MGSCRRGLVWVMLLCFAAPVCADVVVDARPLPLEPPPPGRAGPMRLPGESAGEEPVYLALQPPARRDLDEDAIRDLPAAVLRVAEAAMDFSIEVGRAMAPPIDVTRHVLASTDAEAERIRRRERVRERTRRAVEAERMRPQLIVDYAVRVVVGLLLGFGIWHVLQR